MSLQKGRQLDTIYNSTTGVPPDLHFNRLPGSIRSQRSLKINDFTAPLRHLLAFDEKPFG